MKKQNTSDTQGSLPFVDLTTVDPRNDVRKVSKRRDERIHHIDIGIIRIRPGKNRATFNWRRQPEGMTDELYEMQLGIPALADGIYNSNGPDDEIVGDFKDGLFYINGGERRFRALRHLLATGRDTYPNGEPINIVTILQNPKDFTDKDRRRRIFTSENNMKYTPLEHGYGYLEMKEEDGLTHEQIAQELGISRQTVDNHILLTTLPVDIQQKIDSGEINMTTALTELRAEKKKNKPGKAIIDEETGENLGILTEAQERHLAEKAKEEEKLRGDEDEFIQEDNSITGTSSKGGPKGEGSGAVVIGKDAIYMDQQKLALWKQFVNRYEKVKTDIMDANRSTRAWEDALAEQLKNEYNLTVK